MADELRRPKVPHEDEPVLAPQIVMEGMRAGLSAAVNMAQMRRQTESDMARMAMQEKQNQEQHALEMRKLDQHAEMIPYQQELASAHADYYKNYETNRTSAAVRDYRWNEQEETMVNDVNNQARKLQLLDPALPTRNPVAYAESALAFRDMYQHSDKPWLRSAVRNVMGKAEAQKITIKRAFRDSAGNWAGEDGQPVQVPFYQVVLKLKNPATKEEALKELEFGGQIGNKTETLERPAQHWFKNFFGVTEEYEKKTPFESPEAKMIKEGAETYEFAPQKSRVPAAMVPKNAKAPGTAPTQLPFERTAEPAADEEGLSILPDQANAAPAGPVGNGGYELTESDRLLSQAIRALRMGAAPNLVAARLQENGVDPSTLFGEGDGTMMA